MSEKIKWQTEKLPKLAHSLHQRTVTAQTVLLSAVELARSRGAFKSKRNGSYH